MKPMLKAYRPFPIVVFTCDLFQTPDGQPILPKVGDYVKCIDGQVVKVTTIEWDLEQEIVWVHGDVIGEVPRPAAAYVVTK